MGDFYAINAKVSDLKRGIFDKTDYDKIISFGERSSIIDYLKPNPIYKDKIEMLLGESVLRRSIETFILQSEANVLLKLRHHFSGNDKRLVDAMLLKYEFEDVKLILRALSQNETIDKDKDLLLYENEQKLSYDQLLASESIRQAVEYLSTTSYKRVFAGLTDEDTKTLQFHTEMRLDSAYFSALNDAISTFSGKSSKILSDYVTSKIDIFNVKWIYRAKKYYKMLPEEIYNYSFRFGRKVRGQVLKDLVYAGSIEEFIQLIKKYKLDDIFYDIDSNDRTVKFSFLYMYEKSLKGIGNYENNIGMFLKFYVSMIIQNKNLTRIGESQKYGLSKEETEKYLVKMA
ncbi:V-type ATPase subunit [Criibacterium bergeronii]|uniref:V-type ATPase subunit n=1 Tax=Criibacterium bergeronii TaxID=1871336 RepID=A0A552V4K3_9FIRM|nr:V-type ATPase subunit [Criibacterium bergeronii]TRW25415.1 V-type ATPase subunit [Criibacterium bergeronii]